VRLLVSLLMRGSIAAVAMEDRDRRDLARWRIARGWKG
jgi:hypothetical protein